MYLRDFMFDFIPVWDEQMIQEIMSANQLTHNEATQAYYTENLKQKYFEYRLQTRCIASMYSRLLGKYINDKCTRLIIKGIESSVNQGVLCLGSMMEVQVTFDFSIFEGNVSKREKKVYFLEKLMEGICKVVKSEDWNMRPFSDVEKEIISLDYRNEWYWGKPIKSPNKQLNVQILVAHDVDVVEIYAIFKNKNNSEVYRRILISESRPDEWFYSEYLGKLEWLSDDEIILRGKKKENALRTNVCD